MLQSSILPKLLAKEDITIRHGNYHTAWFDVKNRVLGLPNWKDMGKDVYDLLCGHEVGHALFTPESGWHDSPEKLKGAPRSYLNVIEDARIEREIRNTYPGLIAAMQRGYKELLKREFFGDIHNLEWHEIKLIDKINLKTKLGSIILKYTQENQEELLKPQELPQVIQDLIDQIEEKEEQQQEEQDQGPQGGHDDYPADQEEKEEEEAPASEEGEQQVETQDSEEKEEPTLEDLQEELKQLASQPEHQPDADISDTDEAFRSKEETLIDRGNGEGFTIINELRPYHIKNAVIGYDELKKERQYAAKLRDIDSEYKKEDFIEQRKAAYRYTRATTAKTGRLDVGKLWSYKTSEDIFSQVTTLADAKNHGMIMLVDYSGSMSASMPYVMDQLLHMIHFCKAVQIPFDVYGFTTQSSAFDYDNEEFRSQLQDGDLDMNRLSMPLVCSSSLNKKDFIDSIFHMFLRKEDSYWDDIAPIGYSEQYGSTPLDQALIVSHHLVKEFKQKHRVEKMNFVTFTDGDANGMSAMQMKALASKKISERTYRSRRIAIIQKKKVMLEDYRPTDTLLRNLGKSLNVKTMGFFMADDAYHFRNRIGRLANYCESNDWDTDFRKECNKEYNKNKCVHKENAFGYDNYYLLKGGKSLSATDGEFDEKVTENMSDAQIKTAFRKFSKGKKTNKVLMTSIGKAVA